MFECEPCFYCFSANICLAFYIILLILDPHERKEWSAIFFPWWKGNK